VTNRLVRRDTLIQILAHTLPLLNLLINLLLFYLSLRAKRSVLIMRFARKESLYLRRLIVLLSNDFIGQRSVLRGLAKELLLFVSVVSVEEVLLVVQESVGGGVALQVREGTGGGGVPGRGLVVSESLFALGP